MPRKPRSDLPRNTAKRSQGSHSRSGSETCPMKLTLRELFALTLIAALMVAWWLDHRRLATDVEEARTRPRMVEKVLREEITSRETVAAEYHGKWVTVEGRLK